MTDPFGQPVNPFMQGQMSEMAEKKKQLESINNRFREQVIAVFCNPHGVQLLETFKEVFLQQPVCPPGCVEGYGYMREGENGLIVRISNIVKNAMKPSPTTTQSVPDIPKEGDKEENGKL